MINIRQKGFDAERAIALDLNAIIHVVRQELGLPALEKVQVQRNQMQTAVGGKDLTGTPGIAIEVKRQEQLSINTWWKQCCVSALALGEQPVLLFRQSKQQWRCILMVELPLPDTNAHIAVRAEISYEDFKTWFKAHIRKGLESSVGSAVGSHPGLFDEKTDHE